MFRLFRNIFSSNNPMCERCSESPPLNNSNLCMGCLNNRASRQREVERSRRDLRNKYLGTCPRRECGDSDWMETLTPGPGHARFPMTRYRCYSCGWIQWM